MKIRFSLILMALSFVLCSATAAYSAEKVYFPFFELINVNYQYQYSTAKLLQGYMDETGRYQLVLPTRPDSLVAVPNAEQARSKAQSLGCPYFIMGDLNRVGETVILSVAMYKSDDGAVVWNDKLKANTPDDLDPILQKVARNIGTENKAAGDGDIYSVTNYQSQQLRQIQAINSFGVSVGGATFFSKPFTDEPFSAGIGAFYLYDARQIILEINGEAYFVSDSKLLQASLNAYLPLYSDNNTPFFGGGLGIATLSSSDHTSTTPDTQDFTGSGLTFLLGGGYMIGRSSTVGIRAHVRYYISTFKMSNPEKSLPHGLLLNLEIYFGR